MPETEESTPEMTPAQERMAKARAARAVAQTTVPENLAVSQDAMAVRAEGQRQAAELAAMPVPEALPQTNNTRVANKLANDADMRLRAARQRADAGMDAPVTYVRVRFTKAGGGKVSMGQHVAGIGEACFEWKEETDLPETVAQKLEERGLAEIL